MDEQMNSDVYYELKWDEHDNITDDYLQYEQW